jgi:hypothetical protein
MHFAGIIFSTSGGDIDFVLAILSFRGELRLTFGGYT